MRLRTLIDEMSDFGLRTTALHAAAKITGDFDAYNRRKSFQIDSMTSGELARPLCHWFKAALGRPLNLDSPVTFDEKIQWLKLYDSTPLKTKCADKFLAREYVREKIGGEYLIPLLGVYESFDDIDFSALPERFALKTNHASGMNWIVSDKSRLDIPAAKKQFDSWMAVCPQVYQFYELHYRDIPRRIIAEEYIEQTDGNLLDYKFMCARGKILFVWCDTDRFTQHKRNVFDEQWNELDVSIAYPRNQEKIPCPPNFEKMKELARILSKEFALVRVDFYDLGNMSWGGGIVRRDDVHLGGGNAQDTSVGMGYGDGTRNRPSGKIHSSSENAKINGTGVFFGEMTFTSGSGIEKIMPESWDLEISAKISLPEKFVLGARRPRGREKGNG